MSKKVKVLPIVYPIYLNPKVTNNLSDRLKELQKALPNLIKLQEKVKVKPTFSHSGVCKNFMALCGAYLDCSYTYCQYWSKFSGQRSFPIKCAGRNAKAAFWLDTDKWTLKTQYGRDRHEYLQFLIDIIKGELEYAKEHNL